MRPTIKGRATERSLLPEQGSELEMYLAEIAPYRVLSREEERALFACVARGEEGAHERFVRHNLRLVVAVARRYADIPTVGLLDLIQEGNLGLLRAIERFDLARGQKFSTYAVWWIRQAISRTLAEQGRTIRLPVYIRTQLARMARLSLRLAEEQGKEPTEAALAEAMGLSVEQVRLLVQVDALPVSLDQPTSSHDERTTLAESLADPACLTPEAVALEQVQGDERTQHLTAALSELTAREQIAVTLRFGLDGSGGYTFQHPRDAQRDGTCCSSPFAGSFSILT